MSDLNPKARINLSKATVLLLDDTPEGIGILVQVVMAFGVKSFHRCNSVEVAQETAQHCALDLVLANSNLRKSSGYEFIEWLRGAKLDPNSFVPAILLTGHTRLSNVRKARDCGANFTVAKPVSPGVLLDRIVWVARENRPFVSCGSYVGPDRRFKDDGPPEGVEGRRHDDAEKQRLREEAENHARDEGEMQDSAPLKEAAR